MGAGTPFDSAEALVASADVALYEAKGNGGNRACVAGPASSERGADFER